MQSGRSLATATMRSMTSCGGSSVAKRTSVEASHGSVRAAEVVNDSPARFEFGMMMIPLPESMCVAASS